MTRFTPPLAFVLTLLSVSPGLAMSIGEGVVVRSGAVDRIDMRLFDLAAVRRLYRTLAERAPGMTEHQRIAALSDLSLMTEAIVGDALAHGLTLDELASAGSSTRGPRVLATHGVAVRDGAAYRLLALGYSAREAAEVVSGRVSQRALDTARMMAVGRGRDEAVRYLSRLNMPATALPLPAEVRPDWDEPVRYLASTDLPAIPVMAMPPPVVRQERDTPIRYLNGSHVETALSYAPSPLTSMAPGPFDALIAHYSDLHDVEEAIVRAIIHTESGFNPAARSRAGAVGLMQLMPATARSLGVDPHVPAQNIEAGVRYFSEMLDRFGRVELALVAYNAGPRTAQRYARGLVSLSRETRKYVQNVLARVKESS